jgi:hypothetical protein
MATLSSLADEVQQRLEEPIGPGIFWSRTYEIYPMLVQAINEASLITGEPEVRQTTPFTITAGGNIFTTPGQAIAIIRIQAPNWIPKTSVWDLDRMTPGWEADTGDAPDSWFPVGLNLFGIHPKLNAPVSCFLSYIALPVNFPRPYTGAEKVDLQTEYVEGIIDSATHLLQAKEYGEEFKSSMKLYDRYLSKMTALSQFAWKKGALRFTRTAGVSARITPKEKS